MKILQLLLLIAFLPLQAYAQALPCRRNDNAATTLQATNGNAVPCAATDKGEFFINRIATPPSILQIFTPVPIATQSGGFPVNVGTPQAQPTIVPLEITPVAIVTVLATAVPTAFGTPQATNASAAKFMQVCNYTDQLIWGAYNGGTSPQFSVAPGGCYWRNWGAANGKVSTSVAIARPGTLPTTGDVEVWFER